MIEPADELVRLRSSECRDEYCRAAEEDAPLALWMEGSRASPDMRYWVAVQMESFELAMAVWSGY